MSRPTVHVFIGAGPANLHRALVIQKNAPDARFIFVDDRFKLDNNAPRYNKDLINREKARANIFRFETDEVTRLLIDEGVKAEEMSALSFERDFVPKDKNKKPVFQRGDDHVFSNKPFTQIQIRDLQLLLLKSIEDNSKDNPPLFFKKKFDEPITEQVLTLIAENSSILAIEPNKNTVHIHVATGALTADDSTLVSFDGKKVLGTLANDGKTVIAPDSTIVGTFNEKGILHDPKELKILFKTKAEFTDSIIYPNQTNIPFDVSEDHFTADVARMTVTPTHGTVTFKILPNNAQCETLRSNQISLDEAPWQDPLKEFGWNLMRPPRIRVFYSNDILYIGAEIPARMMNEKDNNEYEKQVTQYTRKIAQLVFPQMQQKIGELPVNEHLRSRFPTQRGQRGQVLTIERTDPQSGNLLPNNVTTFYHGDSRYLPHYQTGSGFITAFLENELYATIYKQKNMEDLLGWVRKQREDKEAIEEIEEIEEDWVHDSHPDKEVNKSLDLKNTLLNKREIINQYAKDLPLNSTLHQKTSYALEAFKADLFKQCSLEIIEQNQEKVGRYLNALNAQLLDSLSQQNKTLITRYNQCHHLDLKDEDFSQANPKHLAIVLLSTGNAAFLREQMPRLLNIDFNGLEDSKLLHLRDSLVKDFKYSLMVDEMAKRESDPHKLSQNYVNFSKMREMQGIEEQLEAINSKLVAKAKEPYELVAVKKMLLDYTKGGVWGRLTSFAWNRTQSNLDKAEALITKITNNSITREELRQEINELAVGQVFRQGAFKQHILEIKKQLNPEEASTNNKLT